MWHSGGVAIPIPGPSAVTAALSICGYPTDKYCFLGFVPQKKGRKAFLQNAVNQQATAVFFESTHRIEKLLSQLEDILEPRRELMVARELTKLHESIYRGDIGYIKDAMNETRGEFTIVLSPKT